MNFIIIKQNVSNNRYTKISNAPKGAKAELRTYGWTMSSYIILNLSLCCDIYLFCLVLESAYLLSRAFYLQVCFFYLYVFEFCCQLAYGYVLMLILLHASALIVCLCMSLYYVLHVLVC